MGLRHGGLQREPDRWLGKSVRDDARLREELAYCVPLGIPHSEFLSWSSDDQELALSYLRYKASACPGCGTRAEDWARDKDAFITHTEVCPGCERVEQERENDVAKRKGTRISLLPRAVALSKLSEGRLDR